MNEKTDNRKVRRGQVVSAAMDKTIVVETLNVRKNNLYNKRLQRTTKFKVHDEQELAREGDVVRIKETRPISKTKRWRLLEIVQKAGLAEKEKVSGESKEITPGEEL
ncbi:MAG: 30S ribosomal protein S17 [bacterium]